MAEFRLFETMRVSESGEIVLLHRHLERLQNSARYFSFTWDRARLEEGIVEASRSERKPSRLRLTLSQNGVFDVEVGPLPTDAPQLLRISRVRVNSNDPFLYHKTTNRRMYEEPDVVLVNERGEATETTIANIAVLREGRWVTPPVPCGLLPGVMRAELLARDEIAEGIIRSAELAAGQTVRCFNALRGIFDARMES